MLKFIGFITLLAVVLFAIGWGLGWVNVSSVEAGEKTTVQVGIDGDAVERDTEAFRREAKELWRDIRNSDPEEVENHIATADRVVRGELTAIQEGAIVVRSNEVGETVPIAATTVLLRNGEEVEGLTALRPGDDVVVAMKDFDENRLVTLVQATGEDQ